MRVVMAKEKAGFPSGMPAPQIERLLALGLQDFLATVKTARRDVVTQMRFTRGRLNSQRGCSQEIVGAMHATLGWGFFVLLNGHVDTPKIISSACL